jgi:hypothetical protein
LLGDNVSTTDYIFISVDAGGRENYKIKWNSFLATRSPLNAASSKLTVAPTVWPDGTQISLPVSRLDTWLPSLKF